MRFKIALLLFFLMFSFLVVMAPESDAAELRLSLQNSYAPWPEVATPVPRALGAERQLSPGPGASAPSVSNRVWTMSGHALLSGQGDTLEKFLAYSEVQIRNRLKSYLKDNPTLNSQTEDLIILDMEHPVHPKALGQYAGAKHAQVVEAFKTRIKVARQEFPNAKLSIYGVIVPDPRGDSSYAKFKEMMQGYIMAGQLGMFDDLDYLSPVLYLRFAPKEKGYNAIEAYTRQGIEASRVIKNSKGIQLPLVPLLSTKIFNPRSQSNRQCAPAESIRKQMKIVREYPYVQMIVLWAGNAESATKAEGCAPPKLIQALNAS